MPEKLSTCSLKKKKQRGIGLSAWPKIVAFPEGIQLHCSLARMALEESVFIRNSVIQFYAECGDLGYASNVFDEMLERNTVSWTKNYRIQFNSLFDDRKISKMSVNDESQNLSMNEEVGVSLPSSNEVRGMAARKKRARTSVVWTTFEDFDEGPDQGRRAKCKKCGTILKCDSGTGTGSMLRHHNKCSISDVVSPQSSTRSDSFSIDRFRELVIEAIVRHDLPFSFVEYEGIRDVFQYISPQLTLPSRNTVKAHVLKTYDSEKVKLKNLLSSAKGRISLTADLWTSVVTDGYLTITAHFVNSEWRLEKRIINFCHMPPPHNGVALADKVFTLIGEWGIEEKLFSITLDNATANDSFVEKLKMRLNFIGLLLVDGKFFHVRCCAHILNLIVQDGLKEIHPSVTKIREDIKYIKGSEVRKQRFLQCVSQVGLGGSRRGLRQDMPTRWNSTYLMLDGALYYRSALMNLAVSDNSFKWCPSDEEWDKIEKINKFLGEFYEVTVLFSGTKYPTSNLFFPKVLVVQHSIQEAIASEDSFLSRMGKEMDLKFKKYWSDYSLILGIAVVMDPRFKMEFVEWAYEKLYGRESSQLKVFTDTLSSLFGAYKETSTHQSSSYHIHESSSQIQGKPCILQVTN
ncbi:zinc finger BED domain-containing protein RICESLEEPER 2-like [Argentina anserina]|uniref:zinc finger BED domain-containing protein RICESLEEPER 2-like n=1 Tax=Argentina anserina TaxID=57926 RepID=UPI0021765A00|nr:zinc finger BED domain-containing protein RICESLEEPER 2-like [Potentilla anserina]